MLFEALYSHMHSSFTSLTVSKKKVVSVFRDSANKIVLIETEIRMWYIYNI